MRKFFRKIISGEKSVDGHTEYCKSVAAADNLSAAAIFYYLRFLEKLIYNIV